MVQLKGKNSILRDGLMQVQFDMQNAYSYIETVSTSKINPTLINPPDLQYLLCDIKDS